MDGWIKVHRKLLKNPIVMKDGDYLAVWMYLLLHAAHEGVEVIFHGQKRILEPGQLMTSRRVIAKHLKISDSKIERVLNAFENEHQIEQRTDRQSRLISIVMWNEYQQSKPRSTPRVNHDRTTSEPQNKNDKNDKNIRINIYAHSDPLFAAFWSAYPRKVGKGAAEKAWAKINPDQKLAEKMVESVENAKKTSQWKKDNGQFIPYPATWLNQERWNDEYIPDDTIDIFKDL